MPGGGHALLEALLDGGDDLVEGEAGGDVLLGRVADLGVHDAVRRQVLDTLARHPRQRGGGLHDRDRVVEGLEVLHQRAGVGHRREPLTQRLGVGSGQRVPDLGGQLDDRGRPQPPVEVVVQQHLRRPPDLLLGDHWACTRFGQDGAHARHRGCQRHEQPQEEPRAHLHRHRPAGRRRGRRTSGPATGSRSTRTASTCSPTPPTTTSGSTSTRSARRRGPFGGDHRARLHDASA